MGNEWTGKPQRRKADAKHRRKNDSKGCLLLVIAAVGVASFASTELVRWLA